MKFRATILSLALVTALFTGCGAKQAEAPKETSKTEAVAGATQAKDEAAFEKMIGKDGGYMTIATKSLTFTKNLTVEGTTTKKDKEGKSVVTRSIALATYKEDKTPNNYTLTVPKLTIKSENTLIEYGTVKGDVYVEAKGFSTKATTIDGNLYFATAELMDEFCIDEASKVTGKTEVKK
jgi:hypothetical protein